MEAIEDTIKSSSGEPFGIIKHVLNFDEENKSHMFNMIQYSLIAIIPILLILKTTKNVFPEEDDSKGNFEILAESVGQIVMLILSIWFTHKFIEYIPTYSGNPYGEFNCICYVVPFLLLLLTMQTKLGAKLNILLERVCDAWNGTSKNNNKDNANTQNNDTVRISQPGISSQMPSRPQHQPSKADSLDVSQLIPRNVNTSIPEPTTNYGVNQSINQNFGQGHARGQQTQFEPTAANDGNFGSPW